MPNLACDELTKLRSIRRTPAILRSAEVCEDSALRGAGGLPLDAHGARFVREVERRDVVTAAIQEVEGIGRGPVRLVLG
jgi:aspartate oxidase